jgi:cell wall-associated NlpC family hydrolase
MLNPMIKAIILSVFAISSLLLSYFYEVTPADTETAVPTATISPYAINSGEDLVNELKLKAPTTYKDTLFYEYYSQTLGLHFDYSEDKELIETITDWIGTPYRYGSSSKKGADCSGFVTSVFREVYGIDLSRSSRSMFEDVKRVKKDSIRTGDLVFFRRSPKQPIFHVGIYLKNNKFIHSATNGGVMVSSLKEPYYRNYYYAAGRIN